MRLHVVAEQFAARFQVSAVVVQLLYVLACIHLLVLLLASAWVTWGGGLAPDTSSGGGGILPLKSWGGGVIWPLTLRLLDWF